MTIIIDEALLFRVAFWWVTCGSIIITIFAVIILIRKRMRKHRRGYAKASSKK